MSSLNLRSLGKPAWEDGLAIGSERQEVVAEAKVSPAGVGIALIVLLVANLYMLSSGRGPAAVMAAHIALTLLTLGALAFSRRPAAAVIVGLLTLWMFLGLSAGAFIVLGLVLVGVMLGLPLFAVVGLVTVGCLLFLGDGEKSYATLDDFTELIRHITQLTEKDVLLAIPFFVLSGAIMTGGVIAERLIDLARAMVGWMPGGLAIATVAACIFFAAISGSSPVTVIAIGSMMYPALIKAGYSEKFSLGLVTSAGSLGILIPPSIPMIVYSIMVTGAAAVDPRDLFLAGVGPGLLIGGLLALYGIKEGLLATDKLSPAQRRGMIALAVGVVLTGVGGVLAIKAGASGMAIALGLLGLWAGVAALTPIDWADLRRALAEGIWALLLPVVILGGIYSGLFSATEAAAVAVVYAVVVERWIYHSMDFRGMLQPVIDSVIMMGALLVIIGMALGFNAYLVDNQIPDQAVAWLAEMELGKIGFLLLLNLFLLVVGALMDILSAILIVAPLVAPMAIQLGVDPVHLGIIFIVNLEIGYLTPPMGLNLFVSSGLFNRSIGHVISATFPFTRLMLLGLLVVTYVPDVSIGPVKWWKASLAAEKEAAGEAPAPESSASLADLMAQAGIDDEDDYDDEDDDEDDETAGDETEAGERLEQELDALKARVDALESQD
jgi:C4-dicarboxylate transporter DctM subunit